MAGNVGTALASLPGTLEPGAVIVCEASSFQLEDTEAFAPEAAVLLNLAEDHLDRHGTFEAYRAAKLEIFAHQPRGIARGGAGGAPARGRGRAAARVTFGEAGAADDGATVCDAGALGDGAPDLVHRDGTLFWRGEPLMAAAEIRLRGAHNRENAMAAAAVCLARGVERRRRPRGARDVRRRPAPARGGRDGRRRHLRQRLEGHQRRVGRGRRSARSPAACT